MAQSENGPSTFDTGATDGNGLVPTDSTTNKPNQPDVNDEGRDAIVEAEAKSNDSSDDTTESPEATADKKGDDK